ncbi:tyrosine--tRNA ligase [Buchnera aphidicola (Mollitrichosiphum nigrofasciatum)]|uniref:tyrosine--tRNA ligase n=1 Tax=Buchnera aphidicola TaxID=9 RepID=UPI0031B89DA8
MYICKLMNELRFRGYIYQMTDQKLILKYFSNKSNSLYCGFDPTADSLHVGHILPLFCLRIFKFYGHTPFIIVGGATSLIGDPSFKNSFREHYSLFDIKLRVLKITKQINLFLHSNIKNSYFILNNYKWFKKINVIDFFKKIGIYFSISSMINKDSIKKRIYRKKQGILYSEFSYNLLQSYDFAYLYKKYNVLLQIGGSDQWGNITSGIDLTRKLYKSNVCGMTLPLLIQSNGLKFGKSEKNTIWLDSKRTSPYKFFQFWLNIDDRDVIQFLKFFSTFSLSNIMKIEEKFFCKKIHPIYLKYIIACSLTHFIHGLDKLYSVKRITSVLFGGNIDIITLYDFQQLEKDGIPFLNIYDILDLETVLVLSSFAPSKTQARKMIASNAISINQKKIDVKYIFKKSDKLYKKYTLLSKGKKNHLLLIWNFY